ncbi:SDR family oxidoreductase [Sphingomonas cavernae]|uniref:SDR family oxidoreductase n=1 Tax=Sphingomonas cavernae TaxID=2320861 RepID=A0A418WPE9_9SPHN|nr:SDR family oxidoreductase [Sphingomonas cavernae]RJF93105.1 SDR family oxidoreductase [Sphingomonas cavernae]
MAEQKRIALVTGGSRGIGRAIAERLLGDGMRVVICGRTSPDDLPRHGDSISEFESCDVRSVDEVSAMVDRIAERHGRLDLVVNNAGGSPEADAATASPRLSEKVIALNLLAPLHVSQAANRIMQAQETGGSIINIASVSGVRPSPGTAVYGAAKAGLLSLTQSLAMEWGPKVRVNAVIVGLVATEAAADHYGGAEGMERIGAMLPLGRMARGSDVAAAVAFLGSADAAYVSGAQIAVHGGGERPLFLNLARGE